jgi:hypothetical protein
MAAAGEHSRLLRERASDSAESVQRKERIGTGPASPASDDIRLALHTVLNSPEFNSVVQLRSFLNYVVTKAVEDRPDEIKGYTIAVEALGRDASFDPVSDPIVRVEAARLRRRLDKYYAGSGAEDPLIIEIPKGTYAPQFAWRSSPENAPAPDLRIAAMTRAAPSTEGDTLRPPVIAIGDIFEATESTQGTGTGYVQQAKELPESARRTSNVRETGETAAPESRSPEQDPAWHRTPITLASLISVALVTFLAGVALGLAL